MARFVQSGSCPEDEYQRLTAKLVSWKYEQSIWNAATIIAAGEIAGWNVSAWPFRQCIDMFRKHEMHLLQRVQIAVEILRRLRQSSCDETRQAPVIHSVLGAVNDIAAVRALLPRLDSIFRDDRQSALFLRSEILTWLGF